jgi:ATP-dependent DNA helicase RecG
VTGARPPQVLAAVASGEAQVVVGTHALMQEHVAFDDLALADRRRATSFRRAPAPALRDKGAGRRSRPHQLVMTATPIPRTLAMAAYADLDVSAIDELPPGRTPVHTVALSADKAPELVERIRAACAEGRQAIGCARLIDDSDEGRGAAAQSTFDALSAALPPVRRKPGPRPHEGDGKAVDDARLQGRRARPAGGDDGDRSRRRRAERLADGGGERRAPGPVAVAPVARAGWGGAVPRRVACCCISRRCRRWPGNAWKPCAKPTTVRHRREGPAIARPGRIARHAADRAGGVRVADLARDAALLPRVRTLADRCWPTTRRSADRVVQRWVGGAARYASA